MQDIREFIKLYGEGGAKERSTTCKLCGIALNYIEISQFPDIKPNVCDECFKKVESKRLDDLLQSKLRCLPYNDWDDEKGHLNVLNACLRHDRTKSLYLMGPTGTCKTRALCELGKAIIREGGEILYWSAPALMREYSACLGRSVDLASNLIRDIVTFVGVIFIDDLGVGSKTPRAEELLYEVVDGRLRLGRPLWITSNLNPDELADWLGEHMGPRIVRRLVDMCKIIETGKLK